MLRFLTALVALLPLSLAAPFEGNGIINLVLNSKTVGCMQRSGQFSSNTASCTTVFGYKNTTYYEFGAVLTCAAYSRPIRPMPDR